MILFAAFIAILAGCNDTKGSTQPSGTLPLPPPPSPAGAGGGKSTTD